MIWDPRTSRRNFWPSHSVRCRFRVLCRWNRWLGWYQNFWRNLNHLVFSMSQIGGRVYASSPVAGCLRLFHYAILCERKVDVLKNLVGCSDTPLLVKIFESSHNDATCAMRVRALPSNGFEAITMIWSSDIHHARPTRAVYSASFEIRTEISGKFCFTTVWITRTWLRVTFVPS